MIKPSTQKQDNRILKLLEEGKHPKEIVLKLKLSGVWAVTNAKWRSLRDRRRKERGTGDRRAGN